MMNYLKYQKAIHCLWIMLKFISLIYWPITFAIQIFIYCLTYPHFPEFNPIELFKSVIKSHITGNDIDNINDIRKAID